MVKTRLMAGIYIHIPFCKQACHYCDFHFSTSLNKRTDMVAAICIELELRKQEATESIGTIYFGGGTPSLLTSEELQLIFETIYTNYTVTEDPEITLEANPDDLNVKTINNLADSPINRLSIGIQSFFEQDLKLMNRAHKVEEAKESIRLAKKHFKNYSIDLIYGIPEMTNDRWLENLKTALDFGVPHLSCYALTVEPKTALKTFIDKGIVPPVDDEVARQHHSLLIKRMKTAGYDNYEFSNFGKPDFYSENNMAYWQGASYIGIGPSAHSYDGDKRSWNVANNTKYIKSLKEGKLPSVSEELSLVDKYNEFVMTRLRTMWGVSLKEVEDLFGRRYLRYLKGQSEIHLANQLLELQDDRLIVSEKGKFLSDGIAADLFLVNLEN